MKRRLFPPCSVASPCRIPHTAAGLRLAWQKNPSVSFVPLLPVCDTSAVNFAFNEHFFPRFAKNTDYGYGAGTGRTYLIAPSYVKIPTVEMTYLMLDALNASARAKNLVIIGSALRPEDGFLTVIMTNFLRQPFWRTRKVFIVDPAAIRWLGAPRARERHMNSSLDHARGLLAMELPIPDGVPDNVVCTMPENSKTLTVYEHGFEVADDRGIESLKIIALED